MAFSGDFLVEILLLNSPESQSAKVVLSTVSRLTGSCLLPLLASCGLLFAWYLYCCHRGWVAISSQHKILVIISVYFCFTQMLFLAANRFAFGKASGRKVLINTFLSNLFVVCLTCLHLLPLPVRKPPTAIYELPADNLRPTPDDSNSEV